VARKLGHHREALTVLVHELGDGPSAEAYCVLGGEVVPASTAWLVGEAHGEVQPWVGALFGPVPKDAVVGRREKEVVRGPGKEDLLKVLLEVHMQQGWVALSCSGPRFPFLIGARRSGTCLSSGRRGC
jgi:vacuolar protein sorting-associated protein 3